MDKWRSPQLFMPPADFCSTPSDDGGTSDRQALKRDARASHKGVEGPHINACCLVIIRAYAHNDAGDLLPSITTPTQQVNGDWVLFYPVYTPEELKTVEASGR